MEGNRRKKSGNQLRAGHESPKSVPSDWNQSADWYDELVGERGHIHHERTIIPGLKRLLKLEPGQRLLDIACGQGVVCRAFAADGIRVTGIDLAEDLIQMARRRVQHTERERYYRGDVRHLMDVLPKSEAGFDAATCVLAITNMTPLSPVWQSLAAFLKPQGALVIVLLHPCFRIPQNSDWHFDEAGNRQLRTIGRYLSSSKFAIQMHPGAAPGEMTQTFHRPLQAYVNTLASAGFFIEHLDEWISTKRPPEGRRFEATERARREIPLFLAIKARLIRPAVADEALSQ